MVRLAGLFFHKDLVYLRWMPICPKCQFDGLPLQKGGARSCAKCGTSLDTTPVPTTPEAVKSVAMPWDVAPSPETTPAPQDGATAAPQPTEEAPNAYVAHDKYDTTFLISNIQKGRRRIWWVVAGIVVCAVVVLLLV